MHGLCVISKTPNQSSKLETLKNIKVESTKKSGFKFVYYFLRWNSEKDEEGKLFCNLYSLL